MKRPLGEFEAELGDGFCQVGRAMIVNLRRIRCVGRSSVQSTDGTTLPLPRGAYEPLNRTIIDQTRLRMAGSRPAGCRKAVPGWTGQNTKEGTMWFRGRDKADRAIAAYQRELVDTHYREVENMYRQMRMWRHDYRNHLQTMKALAANGDLAALRDYLTVSIPSSRRWIPRSSPAMRWPTRF